MADEPPSDEHGSTRPAKKMSLRTLILLASEAFPFSTENLGSVQGRSLSGSMETALVERLPENDQLSALEVARIFMGCTCGLPEETPDRPVFKPLTVDEANRLTDADVHGFAKQYLERIAKQPVAHDAIAEFAAYGREQRRRIADELTKHGKDVRDSLRTLSANSSIMENWHALQDSVRSPVVDLQREIERAMGPTALATDAIRDAIEAIRNPARATDAVRALIDAEHSRAEQFQTIQERLQADMDAYRGQLDIVNSSALERIRRELEGPAAEAFTQMQQQLDVVKSSAAERIRSALEGPAAKAWADIQQQLDDARAVAAERIHAELERLPSFDAPSNDSEALKIQLPKLPPFHETPLGKAALAVEGIRDAGGRLEGAMDLIVNQVGVVSKLIGEVSSTIQTESRQFQLKSELQTNKAVRYARVSLAVAAAALVVSAWFGWLGYNADRADAKSQGGEARTVIEQLREQNRQLASLLSEQRLANQRLVPPANPSPPAPKKKLPAGQKGAVNPKPAPPPPGRP